MSYWHREQEFARIFWLSLIALIAAPIALQAQDPKGERFVLETRGFVIPGSQITVSPKVAGQVVEMLFEEGQQVKLGDVLARLDSEEYKPALLLARAKLKLAEAELANAKGGDRAIAEAKIDVARAGVAVAQYQMDCTTIRAPISGLVLSKRVEVGTRMDPKAAQVPANLCDMADLRTIEVETWIAERDLAKFGKGQACEIQVDAFPNATFRGRVVRLQPVADRARGAVAVRVRLETTAASEMLRPELSAIVRFRVRE